MFASALPVGMKTVLAVAVQIVGMWMYCSALRLRLKGILLLAYNCWFCSFSKRQAFSDLLLNSLTDSCSATVFAEVFIHLLSLSNVYSCYLLVNVYLFCECTLFVQYDISSSSIKEYCLGLAHSRLWNHILRSEFPWWTQEILAILEYWKYWLFLSEG